MEYIHTSFVVIEKCALEVQNIFELYDDEDEDDEEMDDSNRTKTPLDWNKNVCWRD